MILYLEFQTHGRRGGELYHRRLHAFLKKRFAGVFPEALAPLPESVRTPQEQIRYCLEIVQRYEPRLIVSDISSAARNLAAVRGVLRRGGQLMLVIQAKPDPAAGRSWWRRFLAGRCENYLFRSAALAVANSAFTASLARRLAHSNLPVVIAPPGLEVAPPDNPPTRSDEKGPLRLLYVGEISRVKGALHLIEALGRIPSLDFHLDLVGGHTQESDYRAAVIAAVTESGLGARVTFHDFAERPRLEEFYRSSDILIVPSRSEGYGMVIAEGFCFGLPVIASSAGAISEIVTDGVNGLLALPGDADALGGAILRLGEDTALRRRMRAANLEKAQSLPTWDDFERRLDDQLLPQIESLIGQAQTGR